MSARRKKPAAAAEPRPDVLDALCARIEQESREVANATPVDGGPETDRRLSLATGLEIIADVGALPGAANVIDRDLRAEAVRELADILRNMEATPKAAKTNHAAALEAAIERSPSAPKARTFLEHLGLRVEMVVDVKNASVSVLLGWALREGDGDPVEYGLGQLSDDLEMIALATKAPGAGDYDFSAPLCGIQARLGVLAELHRRALERATAELDVATRKP